MKWHIIALILLISCAPATQDVVTKPVMEKHPSMEKQPAAPVIEPTIKAPQEIALPEKKPEPAPVDTKPTLSPQEECLQGCQENCKATAQNACTQKGRPDCKAMCGDNPVIDPSACTQACTYVPNQANACKQQMEQFCSAQCIKSCH